MNTSKFNPNTLGSQVTPDDRDYKVSSRFNRKFRLNGRLSAFTLNLPKGEPTKVLTEARVGTQPTNRR